MYTFPIILYDFYRRIDRQHNKYSRPSSRHLEAKLKKGNGVSPTLSKEKRITLGPLAKIHMDIP